MKWKLRPGQRLRMLWTDDESVIYNDLSGDTHVLTAIATSLLQRLREGPADREGLAALLASEWEFDPDTAPLEVTDRLLDDLAGLCLIEPEAS